MLKKISILLLALILIITFAACGSQGKTENAEVETDVESTEEVDDGWEIADNSAAALPKEVQIAFDEAVEKFTGSELTPIAYIANQIVAGTNYMILCEAETVTA